MIAVPKPVRYVDDEKRAWIRTLPCLVALEEPCTCGPFISVVTRKIVTECAHVRSRGSGGDDVLMVPLCQHHHTGRGDSQHMIGRHRFEHLHAEVLRGSTLVQIGRALHREWLRIQPGVQP